MFKFYIDMYVYFEKSETLALHTTGTYICNTRNTNQCVRTQEDTCTILWLIF